MPHERLVATALLSLVLIPLFVVALGGCVPSEHEECPEDFQCPSGTLCQAGQCALIPPGCMDTGCPERTNCVFTGQSYECAACSSDAECVASTQSSARCVSGECVLGLVACATDSACPRGQSCTAGVCVGCNSNDQCSSGSIYDHPQCLDGQCSGWGLCFDGTQCGSGERCADGACVPSCDPSTVCPTGYSCDETGTCSGNPTICGQAQPACTPGLTCVEAHCVPSCARPADCAAGLVCISGGCIPEQFPKISCLGERTLGDGGPLECPAGRLCLNGTCYVPCDADAGACSAAGADDVCRRVTTLWGEYAVCGSATNLGSECNPSIGTWCAGFSKV